MVKPTVFTASRAGLKPAPSFLSASQPRLVTIVGRVNSPLVSIIVVYITIIGSTMTYDPERYHRGSIRLPHYDYRQAGAYFVTICVVDRKCIFRKIDDGMMQPNESGLVVAEQWAGLPNHYPNASLDAFVIMPNHVHGIICLSDDMHPFVGAGFKPALAQPEYKLRHGLSEIVRGFKTFSSRRINQALGTPGEPVWQRNYYEHVVRGTSDLDTIRKYTVENPLKWAEGPENIEVRRVVAVDLDYDSRWV